MTVNDLINLLSEVNDKTKEIFFFIDSEWVEVGISNLLEYDDRVLLGEEIPPEKYEQDYKYER